MPDLFTLNDVGLNIGATQIVEGISFTIADSGITVLVGPSGSGKSSILRLLNRLEIPTSGTISFRGKDLGEIEATTLRSEVGMVFQRPALLEGSLADNLRVADNHLAPQGVNQALRNVGLDQDLADREASKLSGGEAQRLCLARALLAKPKVLLLDEPTAALDTESVAFVEDYLLTLAREGLAQIWVSHDPRQVERIADTVIEIGVSRQGSAKFAIGT